MLQCARSQVLLPSRTLPPLNNEGEVGNGLLFFLMKITCTRNVMASGQALEAGQVYDVTNADGELLIRMGKAVRAKALDISAVEVKPKAKRTKKTSG
jgi:hypothetical protein